MEKKSINVTVIHVGDVQKVPNKKGFHEVVEVTYKNNSFKDSTESKKFLSFGKCFEEAKALKQTQYTFDLEKGEQYWNVVSIREGHGEAPASTSNVSSSSSPPRGFDVQKAIIRQNSVTNAVNFVSGTEATVDYTLTVAAQFEEWVNRTENSVSSFDDDLPS